MLSDSTQSLCLLALTAPEAGHGNGMFSKAGNSFCVQCYPKVTFLYKYHRKRIYFIGFIAWSHLESPMSNPI